jgi:hypothetical protein
MCGCPGLAEEKECNGIRTGAGRQGKIARNYKCTARNVLRLLQVHEGGSYYSPYRKSRSRIFEIFTDCYVQ